MKLLISILLTLGLTLSFANASSYRMKSGDLIEVWVAQQQGLNRQIVVRPDGFISMPLAGHLRAEGLTPEELETALKERLQEYFKNELHLTVMLSPNPEQEPPMIYVAGDVDQPGAYRFRPGMTVLHAISVAGGFFRAATVEGGDRAIEAKRELETSQRHLDMLRLREARLQAELENRDTLQLPEPSASAAGGPESRVAPQEQSLFETRRENFIRQVASTELLGNTAKKQSSTLDAQIASTNSQIALTEKRLEAIRSLVDRGMTTASRLVDIEISLEELKRTKYALQAEATRAQNEVLQSSETLSRLKSQRHIDLLSELQQVQQGIKDYQSRILASRNMLTLFSGSAEGIGSQSGQEVMRRYTLLRSSNGATQEIEATELTQIQEGDLVRVDDPTIDVRVVASERSSRRERDRDRDRN